LTDQRLEALTIDAERLSPADVESLGESVLGRALRRREAGSGGYSPNGAPIAEFQDLM
jgi:hypothetical protein